MNVLPLKVRAISAKLFTTNLLTAGPDRLHTNKADDNLRSYHDDPRCSCDCTHLIVLVIGKWRLY